MLSQMRPRLGGSAAQTPVQSSSDFAVTHAGSGPTAATAAFKPQLEEVTDHRLLENVATRLAAEQRYSTMLEKELAILRERSDKEAQLKSFETAWALSAEPSSGSGRLIAGRSP